MTVGQSLTVREFWGIKITSVDDGQGLKMNQDGLINKIFDTCGMEYCEFRPTPTAVIAPNGTAPLGK